MFKLLKLNKSAKIHSDLGRLSLDQVAQVGGGDPGSTLTCMASCGSQTTREGTLRCLEKCK